MLEKNGMLRLSKADLEKAKSGEVPEHIKKAWELSDSEAKEMIKQGAFVVINDSETPEK